MDEQVASSVFSYQNEKKLEKQKRNFSAESIWLDDFCVVHESNANSLDQDQTPTRVVKIDVELDEGSPKKGAQKKCRYFLEEINPNSILTHPNFILTSQLYHDIPC